MTDILVAALAYIVPTFPLGYVWHLTVFRDRYAALNIYREKVEPLLGLTSMVIQGIGFAVIYVGVIAPMSGGWLNSGSDLCRPRWVSVVELHDDRRRGEEPDDLGSRFLRHRDCLHGGTVDRRRHRDRASRVGWAKRSVSTVGAVYSAIVAAWARFALPTLRATGQHRLHRVPIHLVPAAFEHRLGALGIPAWSKTSFVPFPSGVSSNLTIE